MLVFKRIAFRLDFNILSLLRGPFHKGCIKKTGQLSLESKKWDFGRLREFKTYSPRACDPAITDIISMLDSIGFLDLMRVS